MKVRNPNDVELPVNGLDVDIELAEEPFARGVSVREFVVPANGEAEFDMQVTANAATALLKIAGGDRKSDDIGYKLKGKLSTDRKSTRLNSSHSQISYAVFCLKKKKK